MFTRGVLFIKLASERRPKSSRARNTPAGCKWQCNKPGRDSKRFRRKLWRSQTHTHTHTRKYFARSEELQRRVQQSIVKRRRVSRRDIGIRRWSSGSCRCCRLFPVVTPRVWGTVDACFYFPYNRCFRGRVNERKINALPVSRAKTERFYDITVLWTPIVIGDKFAPKKIWPSTRPENAWNAYVRLLCYVVFRLRCRNCRFYYCPVKRLLSRHRRWKLLRLRVVADEGVRGNRFDGRVGGYVS